MKRMVLFSIFVASVVCCRLSICMDRERALVRRGTAVLEDRDRDIHDERVRRCQEDDALPHGLEPDGWCCCCLSAVLGCALIVRDILDMATFGFRSEPY